MKNIIKKSLILCCLYYILALVGCNICKCNPEPYKEYKYKELLVSNLRYSFEGDSTFNIFEAKNDSVDKNEYGIRVQVNYDLVSHSSSKNTLNFINTAYACDCVLGDNFSKDSLSKVRIISLNDFDADHPAGADITDYFKILYQNYSPKKITYESIDMATAYNLYAINYQGKTTLDLYLNNTNNITNTAAFEIIMEGANGIKFSTKTKPVFLK